MSEFYSISAISKLLGIDRRTAARLVEPLQPADKNRGHARYRLSDVVRSFASGRVSGESDISLLEAKRRRAAAEAQIAEIELARLAGTMISIEEALEPFGTQCTAIRNRLLAIPHKAAPAAAHQDERSVFKVIKAEVNNALSELSADRDLEAKAIANRVPVDDKEPGK